MTVDEQSRHELYSKLQEVIGVREATTLIEHLPPVGWADVATKRDLDHLEQRMDARFNAMDARVDARFDLVDARFDAVDARFDAVEARFDAMDARLDARFGTVVAQSGESEQRVTGAFRNELMAAFSSQTRSIQLTTVGSMLSLSAIILAASRLL